MTELITTLTLEQRIADAKVARDEAGLTVEECWRRYHRSAHVDSDQRTYDYSDARIADDVYREAQFTLAALLRTRDQERVNKRLLAAIA